MSATTASEAPTNPAPIKATMIGAGSTYTPELADGLMRSRAKIGVAELVLVDPDERRLHILAGFVSRMIEAAESGIAVRATTDLVDGVKDASFVFSQFRVGGQAARDSDEQLGRRWGIVGQETTGVGGLAKGLRTIQVALDVQRAVATHAKPDAWMINFTNPAGMVTEALLTHGVPSPGGATNAPRVVGLCNFPWILRERLAKDLNVSVGDVDLDYVGLNHLAWVRQVTIRGKDRYGDALAAWRAGPDAPFADRLIDDVGLIVNPYLQYYYETERILERQRNHPTRAAEVAEVESGLLRSYADPKTPWEPEMLSGRGGASYSVAAAALAADLHSGTGGEHVVNVVNNGALPGLPDDAVVETTCHVARDGAVPRPTDTLAGPARGLASQVKDYERYAILAAVSGDQRAARMALITHPLCPDSTVAPKLLDDLLTTNRAWLPAFAG